MAKPEETRTKSAIRQNAEGVVLAYIAVRTLQGAVAIVRDGVSFRRVRKAEKNQEK